MFQLVVSKAQDAYSDHICKRAGFSRRPINYCCTVRPKRIATIVIAATVQSSQLSSPIGQLGEIRCRLNIRWHRVCQIKVVLD